MKRTVSETRLDESRIRYRTKIEDDDTGIGTEAAAWRQYYLLKELASQQNLLACGYAQFETLKMYHNGSRWVVELEATVGVG